jgi:hypothetical protein
MYEQGSADPQAYHCCLTRSPSHLHPPKLPAALWLLLGSTQVQVACTLMVALTISSPDCRRQLVLLPAETPHSRDSWLFPSRA